MYKRQKHAMAGVGMKCTVFQRSPIASKEDATNGVSSSDSSSVLKSIVNQKDDVKLTDNDLVNEKIVELLGREEFKKYI